VRRVFDDAPEWESARVNGPTLAELEDRVRESMAYYSGALPQEAALVWDGYFAALLEWGLISVGDHAQLIDMLPEVPNNPVVPLFLGWGSHDETRP
jgi:hypothetical protein